MSTWGLEQSYITREQTHETNQRYRNKMNKERAYYRTFLNRYPRSPDRSSDEYIRIPKEHSRELYFDGHNVWYNLDTKHNTIHQTGYGGTHIYDKGSAQYEYIMDCYKRGREITKIVLHDHTFDENDEYIG